MLDVHGEIASRGRSQLAMEPAALGDVVAGVIVRYLLAFEIAQ